MHTCMQRIVAQVYLHWYMPAVSVCCRAALSSGTAFCQSQCCNAVVVGKCTPVCRADLHRCICTGASLLSAWVAEQA